MLRLGLLENNSSQQVSVQTLSSFVQGFRGGKIGKFYDNWSKLTSDPIILSIVKHGVVINILESIPNSSPFSVGYAEGEKESIGKEVKTLLSKDIIRKSHQTSGDFYSPIFLRDKKDGTYRFILNLKRLNKHVQKTHFKMESIKQVIAMVQPGCWMATIDLKDAYYSVPVHKLSRKHLKFVWDKVIHEFTSLPNGYRDAPRIFTKLMKPVFGTLRNMGHASVVYIDDAFLQGLTYQQCRLNVILTVRVLLALGCTIHPKKSILDPRRELVFLGFVVNSVKMTLALTPEKRIKIRELAKEMMVKKRPTIREVARLVGNLVATSEAVPLAPLYYRKLEKDKAKALKRVKGNHKARMTLTFEALGDLSWWINNLDSVFRSLLPLPI